MYQFNSHCQTPLNDIKVKTKTLKPDHMQKQMIHSLKNSYNKHRWSKIYLQSKKY